MGQQAQGLARLTVLAAALLFAPAAHARTLTVYSSLPLQGVSAAQAEGIVAGIRLALREAGGQAGPYAVRYRSLDDSTAMAGNWHPGRTHRNAQRIARDPSTIFAIGNFNSGASAVAIPTLNQANIPQISPSSTYIGLTAGGPGSERHEPGKYYPTGRQTFFRLPPDDRAQGEALAKEMQADGCARVAIAQTGDTYGAGIGRITQAAAERLGLPVAVYVTAPGRTPAEIGAAVEHAEADCFLFAGVASRRGPAIVKAVAARLPTARLYGGDGVCYDDMARRIRELADRFECTMSTLPVDAYPGGASFAQALGTDHPDPFAIWGYEAMKLGLDTIAALGDRGARREALRRALLATRDRDSVLGTYSILPSGDTTLRTFGVYRATPEGAVAFDHAVTAP